MWSDIRNRKQPGQRQCLNLPHPRSLGWKGEQIICQHILVSCLNLYSPWWSSLAIITSNHCIRQIMVVKQISSQNFVLLRWPLEYFNLYYIFQPLAKRNVEQNKSGKDLNSINCRRTISTSYYVVLLNSKSNVSHPKRSSLAFLPTLAVYGQVLFTQILALVIISCGDEIGFSGKKSLPRKPSSRSSPSLNKIGRCTIRNFLFS